jgi:hypothetical protein
MRMEYFKRLNDPEREKQITELAVAIDALQACLSVLNQLTSPGMPTGSIEAIKTGLEVVLEHMIEPHKPEPHYYQTHLPPGH